MAPLTPSEAALRLGSALLAGALIGIDRQRHRHAAGLRTMILVCVGSAIFAMIGLEISVVDAASLPAGASAVHGTDAASRVVQGIVGGIGFLGAGVVMRAGMRVRGITSAASIWITAAIGVACGFGLYALAGLGLAATLFALVVLKPIEDAYFSGTTQQPPRRRKNNNGGAPPPAQSPESQGPAA